MDLSFGHTQRMMSKRMQTYPVLAKWVHRIFGYTQIGNYARAGIFKKLLTKLPLEECNRILDLGCGQGEYAFSLASAFPRKNIMALDIEPERIRKIEAIAHKQNIRNLSTFCGPVEALPENDYGLDLIYSVDVFEHILEEQMPFESAYACLRDDGFLLIKMPARNQSSIFPERLFNQHQEWLEDEHIGQVYELEDLVNRMEETGFKTVAAFYADGWLSRLAWELNYLARKVHPICQLLLLPLNKLLIKIDQQFPPTKRGNTIQVIGQKISKA